MSPDPSRNGTAALVVLGRLNVIQTNVDPWEDCQPGEDFEEGKTYTPLHRKPKRSKFKRKSK